jgi:F-type H+-transporting ATPase subunit b
MRAWAAEAAAEHAEPLYASAEFWVALAFLIFVALTARTVYRVISVALDDRAERIEGQIEEAKRLAAEAQGLLASIERKQREAAAEADDIVERARREADRLAARGAQDLEKALRRREELAMERLAQAEQSAIAEVRNRAVDVALEATRRILVAEMTADRADRLIDATIKDLPQKLRPH